MHRHYLGGPLSPRNVRNAFLKAHGDADPQNPGNGLGRWYYELSLAAKKRHEIQWFSATGFAYTMTHVDTTRVQLQLEQILDEFVRTTATSPRDLGRTGPSVRKHPESW